MKEIWKIIPGYAGYSASSYGRIRKDSCEHCARKERILKPCGHPYPHVALRDKSGKKVQVSAHVAICLAFHGPKKIGYEVAHNDGNTFNIKPSNLRWATKKDNHADKKLHGTSRKQTGILNVNAKFKQEDIEKIRTLRESGKTTVEIAKLFFTSRGHITNICKGKRWRKSDFEMPLPPRVMV